MPVQMCIALVPHNPISSPNPGTQYPQCGAIESVRGIDLGLVLIMLFLPLLLATEDFFR